MTLSRRLAERYAGLPKAHGAVAWFLAPTNAVGQDVAPPAIRAGVLSGAHVIDGRLNEPAWSVADVIDTFTQVEPTEGTPPSARTVVRVLVGPKALIIGIDCDNPTIGQLVSFSVRRDAPLGSEDHVRVVLGPALDGRSGYVFAVNQESLMAVGPVKQNPWRESWVGAIATVGEGP